MGKGVQDSVTSFMTTKKNKFSSLKVRNSQQTNKEFSMYTFCRNKNACYLTKVNFITEDRMPRYKHLNENRMFTHKVRCSIIKLGKERIGLC